MSTSISINAHTSTFEPNFKKHFSIVKFCIENEVSFPKETSEFFKGKLNGDDLEDIRTDKIIEMLENGLVQDIDIIKITSCTYKIIISELPKNVDTLFVTLS